MGTTMLFVVRSDEGERAEAYFRGRKGGAPRWQSIVDAFDAAAQLVEAERPGTVLRPEPNRSLGRGARVIGSPRTILEIVRRWTLEVEVQDALQAGTLSIMRCLVS